MADALLLAAPDASLDHVVEIDVILWRCLGRTRWRVVKHHEALPSKFGMFKKCAVLRKIIYPVSLACSRSAPS